MSKIEKLNRHSSKWHLEIGILYFLTLLISSCIKLNNWVWTLIASEALKVIRGVLKPIFALDWKFLVLKHNFDVFWNNLFFLIRRNLEFNLAAIKLCFIIQKKSTPLLSSFYNNWNSERFLLGVSGQ